MKNSAELFMDIKKKVEKLGQEISNGATPASVDIAHTINYLATDLLVTVARESNERTARELKRKMLSDTREVGAALEKTRKLLIESAEAEIARKGAEVLTS